MSTEKVYDEDYLDKILNKDSQISKKEVNSGVYLIFRTIIPLSLYNKKPISILCYIGSSNDVEKRIKDPNHIYRKLCEELEYTNTFEMSTITIHRHYCEDYFNLEYKLIQYAKPYYNKTIKQ